MACALALTSACGDSTPPVAADPAATAPSPSAIPADGRPALANAVAATLAGDLRYLRNRRLLRS
ncbi:hypothetical protein AB0M46_44590 [Dactylosporangium sp. NPDC051485]|uniref:hypothetical protein n=1 Tax=Dactylosporangium sp. NPDC051485 TaxID=3154846 RepID=UPI003422C91E